MSFSPRNILVTGAGGFIGRVLCMESLKRGLPVTGTYRGVGKPQATLPYTAIRMADIGPDTDWSGILPGTDVVVHLAARAHILREDASDPHATFSHTNHRGTTKLARDAAGAGVRRLVYVSSIGVNGISTKVTEMFSESDAPTPHNEYALSKWKAEQALHQIASETGLEIVIVRPTLVYGPNAPGNFAELMRVLSMHIPLPLASIRNQRSLIYVKNLVDALLVCATHPAAAGHTYLVSDGEDISTPELLRRLGDGIGCPAQLFPCTPTLLKFACRLIGKAGQVERLLGSLQVDSGKIRRELGWTPPYTLRQGLQATAEWYRNVQGR